MTADLGFAHEVNDSFAQTPAQHHPHRWRLSRAGFVNVWHYLENTFDLSGGRLILRGTNGSGKSRALEMLLPFLLDADRRNMGTGPAVRMEDLMKVGAVEQGGNRLGYSWLELRRDLDPVDSEPLSTESPYLTVGALIRFSASTKEAKVSYFCTPLRVGEDLTLLAPDRRPLSRQDLAKLVGEDRVTDGAEKHRERVRAEVFGLTGELGKDRFDGLMKLLHTLRSPDVGNRIDEGRLPAILSDALPPLSEDALSEAGQQLDGLTSAREDQERLDAARERVHSFLEIYRRYVSGILTGSLEQARNSAGQVLLAQVEADRIADEARSLDGRMTDSQQRHDDLIRTTAQLAATLQGLKDSEAYAGVFELAQLADNVDTCAVAAGNALGTAVEVRLAESSKSNDADAIAGDAEESAAAVSGAIRSARALLREIGLTEHALPATVDVHREPAPEQPELVQTSLAGGPERLIRPAPDVVTVTPSDLPGLAAVVVAAHDAARSRSAQARNRADDARSLEKEHSAVEVANTYAEDALGRADDDAQIADVAREARDDAALDLVDRWRHWTADPVTIDLLGVSDWTDHQQLRVVLADRTALCGDVVDDMISLPDLDRAADDAAAAARDRLAGKLTHLADADAAGDEQIRALTDEQSDLQAAHDPDPQLPFWISASDGVQLWRCLEFTSTVSSQDQAGIEAALLSSGMLTATVDQDSSLTAASGQLLLSANGAHVPSPLTAVLAPDPAGPLSVETVRSILERVALDDRSAHTWIGRDGSWGIGPLRGRHCIPAAQHIGAAARAAARALRLSQIDTELEALRLAAESRRAERSRIERGQAELREKVRSAPRSAPLAAARTRARSATDQARKSDDAARLARTRADELSREWSAHDRQHRTACAHFGLPTDESSLRNLSRSADDAAARCGTIGEGIGALLSQLGRHQSAVAAMADIVDRRRAAESAAAESWDVWHSEKTRLAVLKEKVGAAAVQIQEEVAAAEAAIKANRRAVQEETAQLRRLVGEAATAAANAANATAQVTDRQQELAARITSAVDQLAQPGVVDAGFSTDPGPVFPDPSPSGVTAEAGRLLTALRRGKADENALLRAQQSFEQAISSTYDVSPTVSAGIRLFELINAEGRRPLAQAAVEIARDCERGRAALTDREQKIFTDFVLGEVGEELRRRLGQAKVLVTAMNTSLTSIQTSHGIGVRLTWKLSDDAGGDISRMKELFSIAAPVRTSAQDAELTSLLSARVAAESLNDPTSGYASHLRNALDYRAWHAVEVIITGPDKGQERRISRRAKLSQGETRFVSYVTLFAATDAYLSSLGDTEMSLRLLLLDDAFAKVDEPTIAELLGLLVRLDVDFVMTGHDLWGTVPQVPALDVYEICREGASSAAAAHIHWDGRNRHFLRAT